MEWKERESLTAPHELSQMLMFSLALAYMAAEQNPATNDAIEFNAFQSGHLPRVYERCECNVWDLIADVKINNDEQTNGRIFHPINAYMLDECCTTLIYSVFSPLRRHIRNDI